MLQKKFVFFLQKQNSSFVYVVLQILNKKFLKFFLQFLNQTVELHYYLYRHKLILYSANIGAFYYILSIFNFHDFNKLLFFFKKKKHIINKVGVFNTNIQEEQQLLKDESKLKVYKKSKRKYTFKKFDFETYLSFYPLDNFLNLKNYMYEKISLSSNNVVTQDFFLKFLFISFKNLKVDFFHIFYLLRLKNFFIFCIFFNYIQLLNRFFFYFYIHICQQYIK